MATRPELDSPVPPAAQEPALSPKRQRTRAKLIDAAEHVFARVGVGGATLDVLAERAGLTRGAFYSNYSSKEELFIALADRDSARRLERMKAGAEAAVRHLTELRIDPRDPGAHQKAVDAIVESFLALQEESREEHMIELEMRLHAMRNPEFARRMRRQQRDFVPEFVAVLDSMIQAVNMELKIDLGVAVQMLVAVYFDATVQRFIEESKDGPDLAEVLTQLVGSITTWRADVPGPVEEA